MLEPLDEVYQRGCDLRRFTRDLLEHFRNLAVAKVSDGALLPDLADEEVAALREQAARIAAEDCDRAFRVLLETDEEVARAPYPKLVLEMALLQLAALPPLLPVDELLQRLTEHRRAAARRRAGRARGARAGRAARQPRRRARPGTRRAPPPPPPRGGAAAGAGAAPAPRAGRRSSPSRAASGRRWPSISPSARWRGSTSRAWRSRRRAAFAPTICRAAITCAEIEELGGALLRPAAARRR